MKPSTEPPTGPSFVEDCISLDPDGNLTIINKDIQNQAMYRFRVCSRKLSMASSTFASIFPDDDSHRKQYQISLNDSDTESMRMLFELCHFVRRTPMPPASLENVNALAVSSQRYGLVNLIAPWVMTWSSSLYDNNKLDFSRGGNLVLWLKICLIFGQDEMFKKITRRAIITATAESLSASSSAESPFKEIIEAIALRRIKIIAEVITVALSLLSRYQTGDGICKSENSGLCRKMLMTSVLEGPMSFGLYQPVPLLPYPGMSAMDILGEIKDLQLRTDPGHSGTCGRRIKMEILESLRIAVGVLEITEGLDLGDFQYNLKTEQPGNLFLEIVEYQDIDSLSETSEVQVPAGALDSFSETQATIEDFGPQILFKERIPRETDSIVVGGGREDQIQEGESIIEDFGSQSPSNGKITRAEGSSVAEGKGEGQGKKEKDQEIIINEGGGTDMPKDKPLVHAVARANAEAQGRVWSTPGTELARKYQRGPRTLFPEGITVDDVSGHIADIKVLKARFPALDAKGLLASLKQSNWDLQLATDTLCATESTPTNQNDTNLSDEAITVLNTCILSPAPEYGTYKGPIGGGGLIGSEKIYTPVTENEKPQFPIRGPETLIIYDESDQKPITPQGNPSENLNTSPVSSPVVREPVLGTLSATPQEDLLSNSPIQEVIPLPSPPEPFFDSNSSTSREFSQEAFFAVQAHPPPVVASISDIKSYAPQEIAQRTVIAAQAQSTVASVNDGSSYKLQEMAPASAVTTQAHPSPVVSISDGGSYTPQEMTQKALTGEMARSSSIVASASENSYTLQKVVSESSAPKEAITSTTTFTKVSISRLIAGKLTKEEIEKRFWPAEEDMDIKRGLAVSANRKTVKKLVNRFPESTADKGLIDVLYRSGWDLEKATSRLEGLGLVRRPH